MYFSFYFLFLLMRIKQQNCYHIFMTIQQHNYNNIHSSIAYLNNILENIIRFFLFKFPCSLEYTVSTVLNINGTISSRVRIKLRDFIPDFDSLIKTKKKHFILFYHHFYDVTYFMCYAVILFVVSLTNKPNRCIVANFTSHFV